MQWQHLPERSNEFWIQCIIAITRRLGRSVSRVLLYPISLYFLIINNRTRSASCKFFRHALGREPGFRDYFRQYHTFACSLLDRLAILTEKDEGITIHLEGLEHLERVRDQGMGGILVGSHLGGFDILRMIGRTRGGYRVKAVMFGDATPQIVRIFQELNPSLHEDIITVPGPSAILGLWPDVRKGLMIGLLGDRLMPGERTLSCPFFGEPALFPTTAPYLADILEIPLLQFFCLKRSWGHYDIIFEPLSFQSGGLREEREHRIKQLTEQYARNLEHYAKSAPYNWFNFHDVWELAP
jgi:predicted LPLAT superfamily acyltransferase